MALIEELSIKLSNLQNEDDRLATLQEMKDALLAVSTEERTQTANNLELPLVFDCLNDSNNEQVDLACEVLSICMKNLNIGESTNRYGLFLERALTHPFSTVKLMVLNEIYRYFDTKDINYDLCKRDTLLINLIKCIADDDLQVAKLAGKIITSIGKTQFGLKKLTTGNVFETLSNVMRKNEIVRLRTFEFIIDIAAISTVHFNEMLAAGLLLQIINEIDNEDILMKLNILELLSKLALSKHGFDYFDSIGQLNKISTMIDTNDFLSLQLYEPGILKFFGSLAHWKPIELLSKYPKLFYRLFTNIERKDFTIVGVSLDTIGFIGLPNEGKIAFDSMSEKMDFTIILISHLLGSFPTETKIRALNCIESLLTVESPNSHIIQITNKWFKLLSNKNPLQLIWNYAENPFTDIRLAGFGIIKVLASMEYGQEAIRNTSGMIEFLLSRKVEYVKECKEIKYEIIKILSTSGAFDESTTNRLREFVKEGPFYVEVITEIAIE